MVFYISRFMETWLLPPGLNLLFVLFGLLFLKRTRYLSKIFICFSILSLWVLSTPFVSQSLLDSLQYKYPPLNPLTLTTDLHAAIVVLEAGLNYETPEFGETTVSNNTLSRIRYGAFLYKKTKAAVLVSGNDPVNANINQADYMAKIFEEYFQITPKWKDDKGYNTAQEGKFVAEILKKANVSRIYLVTHAFHMPRSVYAFKNRGLEIIPAPTGFLSFGNSLKDISAIFPNIEALNRSTMVLREYIGILWYYLYYRF